MGLVRILNVLTTNLDAKLHKLYDKTHHEGDNQMDFIVPDSKDNCGAAAASGDTGFTPLPRSTDANTSSDMSFLEEEMETTHLKVDTV